MTVSTLEGPREPRVGDLDSCKSLTPHGPNRMFCEVVRQEDLDLFNDQIWQKFFYSNNKHLQQGLVQQLYGMQRCSMMITKRMVEENIQYRYIVRTRPDVAVVTKMPPIITLLEQNNQREIKIVHDDTCCCGNQDWFGIGHFSAMNIYLNRIIALHSISKSYLTKNHWTAENFLIEYLQTNFGISLIQDKQMVACVVKPTYRSFPSEA